MDAPRNNGRATSGLPSSKGRRRPSTTSEDSTTVGPPPAKKPRLKLNVRERKPSESPGDTIAVSRPRRETQQPSRYSQDLAVKDSESTRKKRSAKRNSPAPSSDLSTLSSAPPSERAESPFKDPTPLSAREEYGDFMSYYIAGGDDEEVKDRPKQKTKARLSVKSKPETQMQTQQPKPPPPPKPPAKPGTKQPQPSPQQQPKPQSVSVQQQQPPRQQIPPPQVSRPPPPMPQPQRFPPLPPGHPGHGPPGPPGRPNPLHPLPSAQRPHNVAAFPQPIIQFIEILPEPKPSAPDTIADMISKLENLSYALTDFGGAREIPAPPRNPMPKPKPKQKPKAKKPAPPVSANPLDNFLSHFGGDDDDDDDDDEEEDQNQKPFLPSAGTPDGALMYGIQFIQNALRSWAQQRMTHQVTQQWNSQQAEQFQRQMQAQRRGPGRPRHHNEDHLITPIIQMNLADTPEGKAIKAFASVLNSGCLQVNSLFPADLSAALRRLYLQIDHLINQGQMINKDGSEWKCLSYAAQIAANRVRVENWKEAHAKAQEEVIRQQQISQQQLMVQMGLKPHQMAPMTTEQQRNQHALDLERKRSSQHALQQPYNSQQHLHPLQLSQLPGAPKTIASSSAVSRPHAATPGSSHSNGDQGANSPAPSRGTTGHVTFDNMKVYNAPGSGPPSVSNGNHRHPMSAPPTQLPLRAGTPNGRASAPVQAGDASTPIEIDDSDTIVVAHAAPAPRSGGFTAVNARSVGSNRQSAVPEASPTVSSPGTSRAGKKQTPGAASASSGSTAANGTVPGKQGTKSAAGFPQPGAIVVDK